MYNPSKYQLGYEAKYNEESRVGQNLRSDFQAERSKSLEFDLVLDGMGVDQMGLTRFSPWTKEFDLKVGELQLGRRTVADRLDEFYEAVFGTREPGQDFRGAPRYLRVIWGPLNYPCRLQSVDVVYTSFDRDGSPLRADLKVKMVYDPVDYYPVLPSTTAGVDWKGALTPTGIQQDEDRVRGRINPQSQSIPIIEGGDLGDDSNIEPIARQGSIP